MTFSGKASSSAEIKAIRPALPLLLFPIGTLWLGIYISEQCIWNSSVHLLLCLLFIVLVLGAFAFMFWRKSKQVISRIALAGLVALLAGLVLGSTYWSTLQSQGDELEESIRLNKSKPFSFCVLDDPSQGAISDTSFAKITFDSGKTGVVRVLWKKDQPTFAMGKKFTAKAGFKPLSENQEFLFQRGAVGSVTLDSIQPIEGKTSLLDWVYEFRNHNIAALSKHPGDGSALLKGVLLGETSQLDTSEAGRAYKATGLSHLVAVSGSHLVVIAILLSFLIRKLNMPKLLEIAIISLFLIAFVVLTGLQPSAIRATVMTLIVSMGPLLKRRSHVPSALSIAAILMLALTPTIAFSVGFWLSVFAVFGLTIFLPLISLYFKCLVPNRLWEHSRCSRFLDTTIVDPLAMTITAQLSTVSITAPLFSTLSLISPLANLLVTPLVTVLVGAGVVMLCVAPIMGDLSNMPIYLLCNIAEISVSIAKLCAQVPYACLPMSANFAASILCMLFLSSLLYYFWPQPSKHNAKKIIAIFGAFVSTLFFIALIPVQAQLIMLDVGQGDAILIREGNTNVLIDTGKSETLLLAALAKQRIAKIDAIIITHLDEDHCGALEGLVGTMPIKEVYFAGGHDSVQGKDEVFRVAQRITGNKAGCLLYGDSIKLGKTLTLEVLWPTKPATKAGNADSLCMELAYDCNADGKIKSKVLLSADLEASELVSLIETLEDPRFDVLKVGHHGSRLSLSNALVEKLQCKVALIGVGSQNRYGHPAKDTLDILNKNNARVLRTDQSGDIAVTFYENGIKVNCDTISNELIGY